MVIKHLSIKERNARSKVGRTEDFHANGDIRGERTPTYPALIFYAWNLPFIAIWPTCDSRSARFKVPPI
ncbi:uncharacterized protein N7473_002066 [Penicillium subrubescens]|jgi:hypothetical protein|uniref:Uncharacterized protein n=1 Tax=Penicillium subrubescens TaxID=1316194 RepID=A0A1Q5UFI1_9EURO|nr:uncharacterized protein N7473_002066 [Penicillium subrubescens]KAJ5905150.1 hypothetical protein N7473_002066 [Penicillium subrubescens]OKP11235.1 hypothetical protein PENSUB_3257 [Penicillium subrubescens]